MPGEDLGRVGARVARDRLAQRVVGVLGIGPGLVERAGDGVEHAGQRAPQALVPVELVDRAQAVAGHELVEALARAVGPDLAQRRTQQVGPGRHPRAAPGASAAAGTPSCSAANAISRSCMRSGDVQRYPSVVSKPRPSTMGHEPVGDLLGVGRGAKSPRSAPLRTMSRNSPRHWEEKASHWGAARAGAARAATARATGRTRRGPGPGYGTATSSSRARRAVGGSSPGCSTRSNRRARGPLQRRDEHLVARREVVVDGARGHARGACDVGDPRGREAALEDRPAGGVEDLLEALGSARIGPARAAGAAARGRALSLRAH